MSHYYLHIRIARHFIGHLDQITLGFDDVRASEKNIHIKKKITHCKKVKTVGLFLCFGVNCSACYVLFSFTSSF